MTVQTQDPAERWADLLQELRGPCRDAAVAALRRSAEAGWPASRESVVSLVAYALGRISAAEYAAQSLVSLGLADAHTAPVLLHAVPTPPAAPAAERALPIASSAIDAGIGAEFLLGDSIGATGRPATNPSESAAKAYVAGRLPRDEFLRAASDDYI
jgi:hypothetical protein